MSSRRSHRSGSRRAPAKAALAVAFAIVLAGAAWYGFSSPDRAQHSGSAAGARARSGAQPSSESNGAVASGLAASASPLAAQAAALATDHVRVCGNSKILDAGPAVAPAGSIKVVAGDNSRVNFRRAHATYWFAPGLHTLGSGEYSQIDPGAGATFVGAPGAVLSGRHVNDYAFADYAPDVTISYLTIENFGTKGSDFDQGTINGDSSLGWTIEDSTIEDNSGAGVMLGSKDKLLSDCLLDNQQYGFNAYSPKGPYGLVMEGNEIAGNDTYNWDAHDPGCGCTGGGKFWHVDGAVIKNNWVHNNRGVGLWADTNNRDFDIEDNYIEGNYAAGLVYEISYNALIENNLFVRNAIVAGPSSPGFPTPAIYVSESGSDSRVAGKYGTTFAITGNMFVDNWSGVVLWENANRFCGSPDNSSSSDCTLVDPAVANLRTCTRAHLEHATASQIPDYFDLCRWKTQNVAVDGNVFDFNPADIGPSCTAAKGCGFVGVFSEWGSDPSWSPYQGTVVETHITKDQNNHFADNEYNGPWRFMAMADGQVVSWQAWRGRYAEDAGSTLDSQPT